MQQGRQAALLRLSALVHLCERLRTCPPDELDFVLVNESHNLLPYQQAALYRTDKAGIAAISGTAVFDASAPYVRWLAQVFESITPRTEAVALDAATLPAALRDEWAQWMAPMPCSFRCPDGMATQAHCLSHDRMRGHRPTSRPCA
ncbi:hypothetical protein RAA17_10390 [Komagataeibacter rhaeticus]|nr:hypothetical protein [Komagataeibacter rhaeticus]